MSICHWFKKRKVKAAVKENPAPEVKERSDLKIGFIVGHTDKSPGAWSPFMGKYEYEIWKDWALKNCPEGSVFFRDKIGIAGAYAEAIKWGAHVLVELHSNAFSDSRAHGTEVLINPKTDANSEQEKFLAENICFEISQRLNLRNRGVKTRAKKGERGFYNLSQVVDRPSVLVESHFLTNQDDCDKFLASLDDHDGRAIYQAITAAVNKMSMVFAAESN